MSDEARSRSGAMRVTCYYTYRNGSDDLAFHLRIALAHFQALHQNWPVAVAVHPTQVEGAQKALSELGVGVPVYANGGALVGEVWLGVEARETRQGSAE